MFSGTEKTDQRYLNDKSAKKLKGPVVLSGHDVELPISKARSLTMFAFSEV